MSHPSRIGTGGANSLGSSHQRTVNVAAHHESESHVNSYPASEQRISEVERGLICTAVLPMPAATTLSVGDSILFALASFPAGQDTCYVKDGDSVCVSLTDVTDLGATDPATGQALFRSLLEAAWSKRFSRHYRQACREVPWRSSSNGLARCSTRDSTE